MERRLRLVLVGLLSLIVLLCVPLASSAAERRTAELESERREQLTFLASLVPSDPADPEQLLRTAVRRYAATYGEPVLVVDESGRALAAAGGLTADTARVRPAVAARLIDAPAAPFPTVLPWRRAPVVLGVTARSGDEVVGAVITEVDTADAATDVGTAWGLVALGGALMVVVAVVVARQLSAWLLSPLRRLEESVVALGEGKARQVEASGPPELQTLVEAHNTMATAVTRSLADQARLVADTAHQLRNPLTAVRLRADLLEGAEGSDLERERRLLVTEIERLQRLLDQMLLLARTEARNARGIATDEPAAVTADVGAVAAERLSAWRPDADERGQTLTLSAAPGIAMAMAQHDLEQLLDVLVGNAVRHAGADARIDVVARPAARGGHTELSVRDDGPGIPADELPLATQRFWQGSATGGGTGLGLAIAAELVAGAAGELRLDSDGGLTVVVTVPSAADAEAVDG